METKFDDFKKLLRSLNNPQNAYPCIHIAGSNGKGSVAFKIAKALEFSGYRVGLNTSPHLFSFCERIQINSEPIAESRVEEISAGWEPTLSFFERATIVAFEYFRQEKVDIAVIETGLGGRLDATNVITSILSIITSISIEHSAILGSTLEEIAAEKAGIIKRRVPVVIGPHADFEAIYKKAAELGSPVYKSYLGGFYDAENNAIARRALELLGIKEDCIAEALTKRPPCRFEKVGEAIFDVAHNPDAFIRLIEALSEQYPNQKKRFVFGMSKDKDWAACLKLIMPIAEHIYLVKASTERAASLKDLSSVLYANYSCYERITEALEVGYPQVLQRKELLVICGSFYIMEEARVFLSPKKMSSISVCVK